jgi:uncharacterized protein YndB with AHSA1/START domain
MSVEVGENGKRFVQVEVEVPGTPEEVWKAIATGPGISSWFVPTEVEERVGGVMKANFGMGMESESTISQWNPPHSFTKDGDGMDPNAPPVATEWVVEAKSGGTCVVRVVHCWFASTEEWDGQWEAVEQGWIAFFGILRLVLQHFPGQPCAAFDVAGTFSGSESEGWAALAGPLGLAEGERSGPALTGKVEAEGHGAEEFRLLLISEPGPGVCHVSAMPMGAQVYVSVRFYLFGPAAPSVVSEVKPIWESWFAERFPMG